MPDRVAADVVGDPMCTPRRDPPLPSQGRAAKRTSRVVPGTGTSPRVRTASAVPGRACGRSTLRPRSASAPCPRAPRIAGMHPWRLEIVPCPPRAVSGFELQGPLGSQLFSQVHGTIDEPRRVEHLQVVDVNDRLVTAAEGMTGQLHRERPAAGQLADLRNRLIERIGSSQY
jgi:hypothetical protein